MPLLGESSDVSKAGVTGVHHEGGMGVLGTSHTRDGRTESVGVFGDSFEGTGVKGQSTAGVGVFGHSDTGRGVVGTTSGSATAVEGFSRDGVGVWAHSENNEGLHAQTNSDQVAAIAAYNLRPGTRGAAIFAKSAEGEGIHVQTTSSTATAVAAYNLNEDGTGAAIFAEKKGQVGHAGVFHGNVHVRGNISATGDICLVNADCAEDFDIAESDGVDPGTVMVLGNNGPLCTCHRAYDKRVAGVVSGAGHYKAGIVLDSQHGRANRQPIALLGKVFCKVDARYAPIDVGDLLTTSETPGHAMKATDPGRAFGTVIGKALQPIATGTGLIPVLIALQ